MIKLTHIFREGDTLRRIGGGTRNGQVCAVEYVHPSDHRVGRVKFEDGREVEAVLEPIYFEIVRRGRNW